MTDKMHTKAFLEKVNYEGLGYALQGYFGPKVVLEGPMAASLEKAWEDASTAMTKFKRLAQLVCEQEEWDFES